jgi:putative membrane protein
MKKPTEIEIKRAKRMITLLSIAIPLCVAIVFGVKIEGYDLSFLPPVYASINACTVVVLLFALWAISIKKNRQLHRKLMRLAIACSVLFLIGYIAYHITSQSTLYGDVDHDNVRSPEEALTVKHSFLAYIFILTSHIILSVALIPLVLLTYLQAYIGKFDRHKKMAHFAYPIWLYVAISGVVVYLMISPYYA